MKSIDNVKIIEYDKKYASKTVTMWRASFEEAIGIKPLHSIESQLNFFKESLVVENKVYLAIYEPSDEPIGIMATDGHELNQLYIHVDFQSIGIGSKLLNLAKELARDKLRLYTFEVNTKAQLFYEKHGFEIIGRGTENEENFPDIQYEWYTYEEPTI